MVQRLVIEMRVPTDLYMKIVNSRHFRVDHGDVFDALLFREETLTRHYFILKLDFSWGIRTNMGKTEGIFLNLQCNCHIVGSINLKLINHHTISARFDSANAAIKN